MSKNKNARKWLIWPLCAGLVISLISPGTTGFAEAVVEQFNEVLLGKPEAQHIIEVPDQAPDIKVEHNNHLERFQEFVSQEEIVHEDKIVQPLTNTATARLMAVDVDRKDVFNLSQEQIEDYLAKGYSIEDLYQLDELANRLLIAPQVIESRKESSKLTWTDLEKLLVQEQEAEQLNALSQDYPKEYAQLQKEKFSDREVLILLISYDEGKGSLSELLKVYRSQGEPGLANYKGTVQKSLQSETSKGSESSIDPEVLERIQVLSKDTGVPLSDLLEQYHTSKELSQQVFVEKE
ncbi:ribbon-helix-helix domain-containing protein [Paenibacillus amylolyticus]|uniref:ribbon-helix-helix domain-containing protein n=1 Tax=Paenibacillus amylolyticus TaxID=1451 RepID=UPI00249A4859|nr:ribbon-helix-helix domain-containing protein [Paenibacillus amylolyticus]WFA85507.1 ribbon-helix-helix domain-containing protein [Paenibacillus amylolyticus]